MRHGSLVVSTVLVSLLAACAPTDGELDDAQEGVDEIASNPQNLAFVTLRQDTRRCISPLCGGVWVRRLNRTTMRCVDGTYAGECYAGTVDWSALNLDERALDEFRSLVAQGRAVVRGRIDPMRDPRWSQVGELIVVGGWQPVSTATASGATWTVRDNGIRCVTAPCFSLGAQRVNVASSVTTLSGLDTSGISGLSSSAAARLRAAVADPAQTVLFAGAVSAQGRGRVLRASQAWTQVSAPVAENAFCTADDQCTRTVYSQDVASREDCFCPFCPTTVVNTETATTRERTYQRYCRTFRQSCPVPRCIAPLPVACVRHACATAPQP